MHNRLGVGWKAAFWIGALAVVVFLLWLVNAVLLPFVMAAVLGYLLDPLANKLERMGLARVWSTTIILVGSLVVIVLVLVLFTPMVGRQVSDFVKALPDLVKRVQDLGTSATESISHGWASKWLAKLGLGDGGAASEIKNSASDLVNKGVAWGMAFANGLLSRGAALLDLFSLIIITPVVAFYMLLDWRNLVATIRRPGAAAQPRQRARDRPRDRPGACRLPARAVAGLPVPRRPGTASDCRSSVSTSGC